MALIKFRDTLLQRVPWWLRFGTARAILWAIGVQLDLQADAAASAVRRRFPGLDSADSLPVIGRERRIRRGPSEPDAIYAARLSHWFDDHKARGNPYTLLDQVGAFYAATPFEIDLIYWSGRRFHRTVDGTITYSDGAPQDTDTVHWARWWLYLQWPTALMSDGVWSDPGVWDDGGVWDSGTLTASDVAQIRLVPTEWNSARPRGTVVLISSVNGGAWDFPVELWSDPGSWGNDGYAYIPLDVLEPAIS